MIIASPGRPNFPLCIACLQPLENLHSKIGTAQRGGWITDRTAMQFGDASSSDHERHLRPSFRSHHSEGRLVSCFKSIRTVKERTSGETCRSSCSYSLSRV